MLVAIELTAEEIESLRARETPASGNRAHNAALLAKLADALPVDA